MTTIPAVNAPKDLGKARLAIVVGDRVMSIPAAGMYQPLDPDLTALAGIGTSIAGDLIYSPSNGTWARLAKGTALQNLRMNAAGTAPEWATIATREVLTADRTYYVRTDGSDSNNGLSNTSGGAFLTLQKAENIARTLDFNGFTVTVQIADGTYTAGIVIGAKTGQADPSKYVIKGNTATPDNVIISTTAASCIFSDTPGAMCLIKDMELRTTTSGSSIRSDNGSVITFTNIRFGTCAGIHILAYVGGTVSSVGGYAIVGSGSAHWFAAGGTIAMLLGITITLSGTPAFSSGFAASQRNGLIECSGLTFSGSATGARYGASSGGGIFTTGAGATYLPGNAAGVEATTGWYV